MDGLLHQEVTEKRSKKIKYYRVSHIEMVETKWLLGVIELRILMNYGAQGLQEVWTFVLSTIEPFDDKNLSSSISTITSDQNCNILSL